MSLSLDVLRLRVLLCFYNNNSKDCSNAKNAVYHRRIINASYNRRE